MAQIGWAFWSWYISFCSVIAVFDSIETTFLESSWSIYHMNFIFYFSLHDLFLFAIFFNLCYCYCFFSCCVTFLLIVATVEYRRHINTPTITEKTDHFTFNKMLIFAIQLDFRSIFLVGVPAMYTETQRKLFSIS